MNLTFLSRFEEKINRVIEILGQYRTENPRIQVAWRIVHGQT